MQFFVLRDKHSMLQGTWQLIRRLLLTVFFIFLILSQNLLHAQEKGGNAGSKPPAQKKPASGGCTEYFPLKPGAHFRYLKTVTTEKNTYIRAYEVFHNYYNAKDRSIQGQSAKGYIREEIMKRLDVPDNRNVQIGDLFTQGIMRKEDRLYYACAMMGEGNEKVAALGEAQEVLKQTSKVVGSYTEVTETYKGNYIVPSDISYREVPEIEYNRIGTGRFNFRCIVPSGISADYVFSSIHEIRTPMAGLGELYQYQKRNFSIIEVLDTLTVLGKNYRNVIRCKEEVLETEKEGKEKGMILGRHDYYYAKGIGLILQVSIEANQATGVADYQILQNLFSPNDKSMVITITELLPEGTNAASFIQKGRMAAMVSYSRNASVIEATPDKPKISKDQLYKTSLDSVKGDITKELLGMWVIPYPNRNTDRISFIFNADGSYEKNDYLNNLWSNEKGMWRKKGEELIMLPELNFITKNNLSSSLIRRHKAHINSDNALKKLSLNLSGGTYYKTTPSEVQSLLAATKPDWMKQRENEPLTGTIDSELVGTWRDGRNKNAYNEYVFRSDGSGHFIMVDKSYNLETKELFNWRVKDGILYKQIICNTPPCPIGDKYIRKEQIKKITEKNRPAFQIFRFGGPFIKQ